MNGLACIIILALCGVLTYLAIRANNRYEALKEEYEHQLKMNVDLLIKLARKEQQK